MKIEEKTYNHQDRNIITNSSSTQQQERTLFPEKLELAKKQLKEVKLPPNKNHK